MDDALCAAPAPRPSWRLFSETGLGATQSASTQDKETRPSWRSGPNDRGAPRQRTAWEVTMRRRCAAVAVSALVLLGCPQPGRAGECATPAGTPAASAGSEAEFARATACVLNEDRAGRGLSQLRRARRLDRAAERHARDMVTRHYFSHANPEGKGLFERVRA